MIQTLTLTVQTQSQALQTQQDQQGTILTTLSPLLPLIQALPLHIENAFTKIHELVLTPSPRGIPPGPNNPPESTTVEKLSSPLGNQAPRSSADIQTGTRSEVFHPDPASPAKSPTPHASSSISYAQSNIASSEAGDIPQFSVGAKKRKRSPVLAEAGLESPSRLPLPRMDVQSRSPPGDLHAKRPALFRKLPRDPLSTISLFPKAEFTPDTAQTYGSISASPTRTNLGKFEETAELAPLLTSPIPLTSTTESEFVSPQPSTIYPGERETTDDQLL